MLNYKVFIIVEGPVGWIMACFRQIMLNHTSKNTPTGRLTTKLQLSINEKTFIDNLLGKKIAEPESYLRIKV